MSLQFSPMESPSPAPLASSRRRSLSRKTPPSRHTNLPSPRARATYSQTSNGFSKSAPASPSFRASPGLSIAPLSLISPIILPQALPDSRQTGHQAPRPGGPRRSSSGADVRNEAESSRAADARARLLQMEQMQRLQIMAQQQAIFSQAQQYQHQQQQPYPNPQQQPKQIQQQQQPRIHPSQPLAPRYLPRKSPGLSQSSSQNTAYPFPNQTRPRSRPRPNPNLSSSESEYDSDVTAVPLGRTSANSKSQPDLVAFRREAASGWAAQQAEERARDRAMPQMQPMSVRQLNAGERAAIAGTAPQTNTAPNVVNGWLGRRPSVGASVAPASGMISSPSSRSQALRALSPLQPTSHLSQALSPGGDHGMPALPPDFMGNSTSPGVLRRSINPLSHSQPSLFSLRDPPIKTSINGFTGSTREATTVSLASSPDIRRRRVNSNSNSNDSGTSGGENDADDDWDAASSSPSSGSLTFSPKKPNGLRQRMKGTLEPSALGLVGVDRGASSGEGDITTETETEGEHGTSWSRREKLSIQAAQGFNVASAYANQSTRPSSLLFFRLLAVVPSWWGILVLLDGARHQGLWADVWPWGVDLSRDAWMARLGEEGFYGGTKANSGTGGQEMHTWQKAGRGELLIAVLWALVTSQFCFSLTTGLTHRWRSYYSLPSTITRLMSLQCLCWPATYATLRVLGAKRPLLAWVVIGVTTGWSRAVQMFVTSNVVEDATVTNTAVTSTFGSASTTPAGHSHDLPLPVKRPPLSDRTGPPPADCSDWEAFLWGRRWDWDKVSRKVINKVALLLLITTAWLFWVEENGGKVRYI